MARATVEAQALAYLARGWAVVPVEAGGKRPLVKWQPFQQRLPSRDEVRDWFRRWPDANLGVVTGRVSGLVVLDVDAGHGGPASLREWERRFAPLPATVSAVSGGGGRHYYFAHPGGSLRNRTGIAQGIDLRGDGGLIVMPPSLHPSGRRYRWVKGGAPDGVGLAPLPEWLLALAQDRTPGGGHPLRYWRSLVQRGVKEGERNSAIASLTGHLLWRGVDPEVALELLLSWNRVRCDPPLDDDEVAHTVGSISRTHAREHQG